MINQKVQYSVGTHFKRVQILNTFQLIAHMHNFCKDTWLKNLTLFIVITLSALDWSPRGPVRIISY